MKLLFSLSSRTRVGGRDRSRNTTHTIYDYAIGSMNIVVNIMPQIADTTDLFVRRLSE